MTGSPLSTRELRDLRSTLAEEVGDDALVRRLVNVGIRTPEALRKRFGSRPAAEYERRLKEIERYHTLGTSLRNISSCSDRISGLVQSLRSYARNDETNNVSVNIHDGIEDTLRLFGQELKEVQVKRAYGDLPSIECRPGELNQVWTNLISNALHAMDESGTLRIDTDVPSPGHVRARITDSGKGIEAEQLERVFDPHFTTKDGRIAFGLGMGLPICRQIVSQHGGVISVESEAGKTCFTVVLPVHQPCQPEGEDVT
jgi:signal transduction histidine kinase